MRYCLLLFTSLCSACQPAQLVTITLPRYPAMALSANVEGTLITRVPVQRDGSAGRASFDSLDAVHQLFALSFRNVLPSARFAPATRLGVPNDAILPMSVSFVLLRPVTPIQPGVPARYIDSLPERCPATADLQHLIVCGHATRYLVSIVY